MVRANSRAAVRMAACFAGLPSTPEIPAAKSSSGTIRPVSPSRTIVFGPPSGVTIAGTPLAIASNTTFPNVSVCDGNTNRSILAYASESASPFSTPGISARGSRSRSQPSSAPWPTIRNRKLRCLTHPSDADLSLGGPGHPLQLFLHLGQQRHVLLDREPPYKAQHMIAVFWIALA